jgi:50S ribosomal protein L16 3-hydroxylase
MPTSRQKTSDSSYRPPFSGDISVETFLQEYWQKKPLLVRNAFPGLECPLTPDELAGLACEGDVNARIVFEQHAQGPWHVLHGPLQEDDFKTLPEKDWTLLVTDVEKHVAEAKELIDRFRFIPDWRIDDLMISYAPEGGSVGPHTDAYDVFLIQAHGQRHWMINKDFDEACIEGTELRILQHFTAADDWILEPGDMLYLPPNIAHHGVAMNECMTCSVGFRAPSISNMVSEYAEYIATGIDQNLRYEDPELQHQQHPAEISPDSLVRILDILATRLRVDNDSLLRWFGEFCSEPRSGMHPHPPDTLFSSYNDLSAALTAASIVTQSPVSKFLFCRYNDAAWLFVDGISYTSSTSFAERLTDTREVSATQLLASIKDQADEQTLLALCNNGCLHIS